MSIFGTGRQEETFPAVGYNAPGHGRIWIRGTSNVYSYSEVPPGVVATISAERQDPGKFQGSGDLGLTRAQVRDAIETLQSILDEVGPEPVVELECDYIIDRGGDYWVRGRERASGWYLSCESPDMARRSRDLREDAGDHGTPFEDVLNAYGPLRPVREVVTTQELDLIGVPA